MIGAFGLPGAHRQQRLQVYRNRTPRREVTARRSDVRPANAREQGPEQEHRSAQPSDEGAVRDMTAHSWCSHAKRRRTHAFNRGAEINQQLHHDIDVPDPGDVRQHALIRRE